MAENSNKEILDAIQGLADAIQGLASHVDERFGQVDERFKQAEELNSLRFTQLEKTLEDWKLNLR